MKRLSFYRVTDRNRAIGLWFRKPRSVGPNSLAVWNWRTEARGLAASITARTAEEAKQEATRYWGTRGHDVRVSDVQVMGLAK